MSGGGGHHRLPTNASQQKLANWRTYTYQKKFEYLLDCARDCYERKGVAATTISDIMREAHLTREVIYYYFANKDEITSWVLNSYLEDAMEQVQCWCERWDSRMQEDDAPLLDALTDAIRTIRSFVFTEEGDYRPMFAVINEVGMRQKMVARMCDEALERFGDHVALQRLRATFPNLSDQQIPNFMKFVVLGTVGLMESTDPRDDIYLARLYFHNMQATKSAHDERHAHDTV